MNQQPSKKIYLTIDDSPSKNTDALIDFLISKDIQAILFARGAFMEEKTSFQKIIRAIKNGFLMANHSYAHDRTSDIGFKNQVNQIAQTQDLIDRAYDEAEVKKPPRYFRFPHLDRGCGTAWVIDFETVPIEYRKYVQSLFWDGVRLESKDLPTPAQKQCKKDIQNWLKDNNFQKFSPPDVTFPWWVQSELGQAIDMLITYSTSDWMATPRYLGKWPYKHTDDLCQKIDDDDFLSTSPSSHIVLMHDDREESLTITKKLITHFLNQNFSFLPVTGVSE
jgi:peptidoglycan/xylan/chitin deacetylase (PgdA/CDA1 family)